VTPSRHESWALEVQIHPSDIRKRVRYLFLSRTQVTAWSVLILLYVLGLALAAGVAPSIVTGLLNRQESSSLLAERAVQGERLQELLARMEQLSERTETAHLRMKKVYFVYGLPVPRARGQGGFPVPPEPKSGRKGAIYSGAIHQGDRLRARIGERLAVLGTFLDEVQSFEQANGEQVRSTPSVCPLRGGDFVLTSPFGSRRSPFTKELEAHTGLDLAAPVGSPIYATADGTVVFAGRYPMERSAVWWRYGNLVIVRNGDRFITLFGHCNEVKVRAGQRVSQGDVLATVGNTGWSTNSHVHYEIRRARGTGGTGGDARFVPVEPLIYILDERWPNEDRLLARARRDPGPADFEPLPPSIEKSVGKRAGK
jgi:murein DD-endopeptidase MepM/ murein hydrolase activator NlpD